MADLASVTISDGVHTISMDDGKANALSHEMFDILEPAVAAAEQDQSIIVLRGREGIFTGGFDLKVMMSGFDAAKKLTDRGSQFARRLMSTPSPVISVSDGHCIAMGAFLMLASDYRIGTDGAFKIGLNETAIGIPMHHFGIELARARLPFPYFNRCVMNAELFAPGPAREVGFYDAAVVPSEMESALEGAIGHFKSIKLPAFKIVKPKARADLLDVLDNAMALDLKADSPF